MKKTRPIMPTEPDPPKLKQKSPAFMPFFNRENMAEKAMASRFLSAFLCPETAGFEARRLWLKTQLYYERLRLGADAQSLYLIGAAAQKGLKPPKLTIGQYLYLLALSDKQG